MKNFKRMLSAILVVVMLVSLFPVSVFAEEEQPQQDQQTENSTTDEKIAVTSITISSDYTDCFVGDVGVLTATVSPEDATDKSVVWSTSNSGVITIDQDGNFTAVAAGTAIITATAADGSGVSAMLEIVVKECPLFAVGETPFTTFSDAMDACPEDGTIYFIDNITVDNYTYDSKSGNYVGLLITKTVTLDLCGHKIEFCEDDTVPEDGWIEPFYSQCDVKIISSSNKLGTITINTDMGSDLGEIIYSDGKTYLEYVMLNGKGKSESGIYSKGEVSINKTAILNVSIPVICGGDIYFTDSQIEGNIIARLMQSEGEQKVSFCGGLYTVKDSGEAPVEIVCPISGNNVNAIIDDSSNGLGINFVLPDDISFDSGIGDTLTLKINNSLTITPENLNLKDYAKTGTDGNYNIYEWTESEAASVGDKIFATFGVAWEYASGLSEATVKLLEDLSITDDETFSGFTVPSGKNITLDLNGHNIEYTYSSDYLFINKGTFTVTDSTVTDSGEGNHGSISGSCIFASSDDNAEVTITGTASAFYSKVEKGKVTVTPGAGSQKTVCKAVNGGTIELTASGDAGAFEIITDPDNAGYFDITISDAEITLQDGETLNSIFKTTDTSGNALNGTQVADLLAKEDNSAPKLNIQLKNASVYGSGKLLDTMIFSGLDNVTTDADIEVTCGIPYEMEIDQYNNHTGNKIHSLSHTGTITDANAVFTCSGNTYTLNGNAYVGFVAEPILSIDPGESVTIDLNGYTLEGFTADSDGSPLVLNNGTATLTDSSVGKTGEIVFKTNGANGAIESSGNLTVTGGTLECLGHCIVISGGELNISGTDAVLYSAEQEPVASEVGASKPVINISSGIIKSTGDIFSLNNTSGNELNISGGSFCSFNLIKNTEYDYSYYAVGKLIADDASCTTNITGGVYYYLQGVYADSSNGYDVYFPTEDEIITDENKTDEVRLYNLTGEYDPSAFDWVTNFRRSFISSYYDRVPDIRVVRSAPDTAVAEIIYNGESQGKYSTLQAAAAVVNESYAGATINVLRDINNGKSGMEFLNITKSMTIDMNGHSLYGVHIKIKPENQTDMPTVTITSTGDKGLIRSKKASSYTELMCVDGNCSVTLKNITVETDYVYCFTSSLNNSCPITITDCDFNNSLLIEDAARLGYSQEEVRQKFADDANYISIKNIKSVAIGGQAIVTDSTFSQGIYAGTLQMTGSNFRQYEASDNKVFNLISCNDDAKTAISSYLRTKGYSEDICLQIESMDDVTLKNNIAAQYLSASVKTEDDKLVFQVKPYILFGELGLEIPVSNANLSGPVEFTLPIPSSVAEKYNSKVYVRHIADNNEIETDGTGIYTVAQNENGEYYISVCVDSFSSFEVLPYDESVSIGCSATLDLQDSIDVLLYLNNLPDGDNIENYKAQVTYKGDITEISCFEQQNDGRYRLALASCTARDMFEKINIVIYRKNSVIKELDYSVYNYCNNMMTNYPENTKLVEVCRSVLDYGYYARNYFQYEEKSAVNQENSAWTVREPVLTDTETGEISALPQAQCTGTCNGITAVSASLSLESKTLVNFKFKLADDYSPDMFKVELNGNQVTGTGIDNNTRLQYTVTGIRSVDLGDSYTVTVTNISDNSSVSVTYSPMTYVKNKQTSTDEALVKVCNALYRYRAAAEDFFGQA